MATLHIPAQLQRFTNGHDTITVPNKNWGDILSDLIKQYPPLSSYLKDENDQLPNFVTLYLNNKDVRFLENSHASLAETDHLTIVLATVGG